MKQILSVPQSLSDDVLALIEREQIALTVVTDGEAAVRVEPAEPRATCSLDVLHPGGRITCHTARAMASKLQVANRSVGKLLNVLDIKVRHCDLECFD